MFIRLIDLDTSSWFIYDIIKSADNHRKEDYMKHLVASLNDLKDKKKMQVNVKYQDILLVYENNHVYAIMDKCPHQGIPLATGMVNGNVIKCKDHGLSISLESGEVLSERQINYLRLDRYSRSVKTYEITIEEDNVFINL